MYQYIYDKFLSEKRFAKELAEVENRLTDLGITGRIDRMHPLKSLRESVDEGIRQGVKTIVAVGSDETLKKLLDVVPEKGLVLGFIPMLAPSNFATALGIPEGVLACDVLSARLTETLDIGRVNGQYFLTDVYFSGDDVTLECDGRFRVSFVRGGKISICNIASFGSEETRHLGNPFDGYLEAVLAPVSERGFFRRVQLEQSVLLLRRVVARAKGPFKLTADGRELEQETAEIDIAERPVRLIIGKDRVFAAAPLAT
jgi:hypothetical protein